MHFFYVDIFILDPHSEFTMERTSNDYLRTPSRNSATTSNSSIYSISDSKSDKNSSCESVGKRSLLSLPLCYTSLPRRRKSSFNKEQLIIFMGATKVGKTSIIKKFIFDKMPSTYKETTHDQYLVNFKSSNKASLTLQIIDTAGRYQFPAMLEWAIQHGHAFVLVYRYGSIDSWTQLKMEREQVSICR